MFATPILGGQLTLGMLALVGNNSTDLNGTLTLAAGSFAIMRQGSISQTTTGFGDLYPQAMIRWNSGVNNWMVYGTGDIPVGDYRRAISPISALVTVPSTAAAATHTLIRKPAVNFRR